MLCFFQHRGNPLLVDRFQSLCRDLQRNPAVFLRDVEPLFGKVYVKPSFGLIDGKRNVVPELGLFPGEFADFGHSATLLGSKQAANLQHF